SLRHQVRGTLAANSQRYWKKFKCRQRRSIVSCTPHRVPHCGHSKCCPRTCSKRSSKRFGSPSKRHSTTRHCWPRPSAAVKSSSGVMAATKLQIGFCAIATEESPEETFPAEK